MSTISATINKLLLIIFVGSISVSCNNNAQEFDQLCQGGWSELSPLSNAIYNKLSLQKYTRYISIKAGNDRDAYSFYFIGQTNNAGYFVHADKHQIIAINLSTDETSKAFSLLPQDIKSLDGFTGSGEVWNNLACSYMRVKTPDITKTFSFHDYILKPDNISQASRRGVDTMLALQQYFIAYSNKIAISKPATLEITDRSSINQLSPEAIKIMDKIKSEQPVFYEIP